MPHRTQYPIHAKIDLPESLRPEVTTVDRWHQPLSEPVRRGAGVLAAAVLLVSSGSAAAPYYSGPEIISVDKWHIRLSEPVRTAPIVPAALMQVVFDDQTIWPQQVTPFAPSVSQDSMVGAVQRTQYQAVAAPVLVETAVPAMDSWFQQLSEPVRVRPPLPIATYPSSWDDPDALTRPETTSPDKWFSSLSEPVLPLSTHTAIATSGEVAPPAFFGPEVTSPDKWFVALSEPVLPLPPRQTAGETHANEILPAPLGIFPDSWFQPFSEPVRTKPPLPIGAIPSFETDAESLTLPEVTTVDRWYVPWPELLLPLPPRQTAGETHANEILPPSAAYDPANDGSPWAVPLNEPFPSIRVNPAALMPVVFDSTSIWPSQIFPAGPSVSQDSMVAGIHRLQYQSVFGPIFVPDVTGPGPEEIEWYVPFNEPVRPAETFAHLRAGEVHANEILPPPPPVESITLDKWFSPFSEPTRRSRTLAYIYASSVDSSEILPEAPGEAIFPGHWYQQPAEPILSLKQLQTAGEIAASPFIGPETTTVSKWFRPLSEPVRRALPPQIGGEFGPPSFFGGEEIFPDKWFQPFSEPVREGPERIAYLYSGTFDDVNIWPPPEITSSNLDKWFYPLSEPVRPRLTYAYLYAGAFEDVGSLPPPISENLMAQERAQFRRIFGRVFGRVN